MKKLSLILSIVCVSLVFCTIESQAQNIIPSYDATISQSNLTFIEDDNPNPNALEERKINVVVEDPKTDEVLPVVIIVFSLDGNSTNMTYTVSETSPLELDIDGTEWGVEVISYTAGTEISVWTE